MTFKRDLSFFVADLREIRLVIYYYHVIYLSGHVNYHYQTKQTAHIT